MRATTQRDINREEKTLTKRCATPNEDLTGQRMVLYYRPYEATCPHCYAPLGSAVLPFTEVVTLLHREYRSSCPHCQHAIRHPEGYWGLDKEIPGDRKSV